MYIDKYKRDGLYYSPNGNSYEDANSFIAEYVLGFCGCGMPNEALDHVKQSLGIVYDLQNKVWTDEITIEQWRESKSRVFASDGAEYFMWYFLNEREFTEHGGSVPGWLTDKGKELLRDLYELNLTD
jgi:hypothetical protein